MRYRANFVVQLMQSLLELLIALVGLALVFAHTPTLAGWHPAQMLALLGVYMLVNGIVGVVIQPSLQHFVNDVRQGTLDFVLLKPREAQVLISFQRIHVWKLGDVLLGTAVLVTACLQAEMSLTLWRTATFVIGLLAGSAILYSFLLLLATCSFWLVRVESILAIFQNLYQAGRWPIGIYPSWLRILLTFLVPVALVTTIPTEALVGSITWQVLLALVGGALISLFASRWFWKQGLRSYTGASA